MGTPRVELGLGGRDDQVPIPEQREFAPSPQDQLIGALLYYQIIAGTNGMPDPEAINQSYRGETRGSNDELVDWQELEGGQFARHWATVYMPDKDTHELERLFDIGARIYAGASIAEFDTIRGNFVGHPLSATNESIPNHIIAAVKVSQGGAKATMQDHLMVGLNGGSRMLNRVIREHFAAYPEPVGQEQVPVPRSGIEKILDEYAMAMRSHERGILRGTADVTTFSKVQVLRTFLEALGMRDKVARIDEQVRRERDEAAKQLYNERGIDDDRPTITSAFPTP